MHRIDDDRTCRLRELKSDFDVLADQPSVDEIVDGQPAAPDASEVDAEAGEPEVEAGETVAESAPEPDPEEERS